MFNKGDIPQEWFSALQGWLKPFDSEIVNIRLPEEELAMRHFNLQNSAHISATKFLIYYIADYVKEDIALYLDCDLIVTGDVVHLLDYDLDGYYIAAVNDSELDPRTNKDVKWELNSGVMLVNIKRWKRENVRDWLLNLSEEHYKEIRNGEQSIMIMAFGQEWLPLDDTYNFFVGYDVYDKSEYRRSRTRLVDNQLPLILHYICAEKPWGTMSRNPFTSLWWFYYGLEQAEEKGLERGRAEGIEQGLERGKVEGREEGKVFAFLDLVHQGFLTSEVASQQLGMTVAEFEALLEEHK